MCGYAAAYVDEYSAFLLSMGLALLDLTRCGDMDTMEPTSRNGFLRPMKESTGFYRFQKTCHMPQKAIYGFSEVAWIHASRDLLIHGGCWYGSHADNEVALYMKNF